MATKKAAKKTPFKKAAKKPVKKKAVKRVYRRKTAAKVEEVQKDTPERSSGEVNGADYGNGTCIDCAEAAPDLLRHLMGGLYVREDSTLEMLEKISAIDLRGMTTTARFAVLAMLNEAGYISTNIGSIVDDLDNLSVFIKADSLRLQHKNKLVIPGLWEDILDCSAIATVHAQTQSEIFFDKPRPVYPEETFLGDARYVRVE